MVKPNSIIQITKSDADTLSIESVKSYLKITHKHDDDLLKMLIASVASKCEIYTGLSLITKDFRLEYTAHNNKFHIPLRPLQKIHSIKASNKYQADEIPIKYYSICEDNVIMHTLFSGKIYICCSCGFGESERDIPPDIKLLMTMHVADLYETRGYQSNFNMEAYDDFRFFKI